MSLAVRNSTDYNTSLFRRLIWEGTVPLEIHVDPKELPANSNRGLEYYYLQAPRVSYLPLVMPQIRKYLMDVVFDDTAAKHLKEEDWWFETEDGTVLKWHWPIGLLYDMHTILASIREQTHSSLVATPMRVILHLATPPSDKLLLSPSSESCKQAFMGQIKEADCVRWGNTKRMTGLRQIEQDGIWEGIKEHNFDDYWRVASKVTPTASMMRSPTPMQSGDAAGTTDKEGAYNVRSVPVRIYLPDGPVLQELVPPVFEDGTPHTLSQFLSTHLSLLFPPQPPPPPPSRANPHPQAPSVPQLAYALVQGVLAPLESEMAWLGACLAGADGWLNICIGISRT